VVAPGGKTDPERRQPERTGLPIEQAAEHARAVEAGEAQPVDRAVGGHERTRVAVGEKCVLGDGRKWRGQGRAMCPGVRHLAPIVGPPYTVGCRRMRQLAPGVWQLDGFPRDAINVYLVE